VQQTVNRTNLKAQAWNFSHSVFFEGVGRNYAFSYRARYKHTYT